MPSCHASHRAALLRAIDARPNILTIDLPAPAGRALSSLHARFDHSAAKLRRTRESRLLSRSRYENAEGFFRGIEHGLRDDRRDRLYQAGIVGQLGLSAHLIDVGFSDAWCARHIALRVAQSLAYANATGLGHRCPEMRRLADVLDPYWKWNHLHRYDQPQPDDGGFSAGQICELLRALLDHVRQVTGHPDVEGTRCLGDQR